MASASQNLQPSWHGHVGSTMEAMILFEGWITGRVGRISRRPHDREREELIRSGNIFIYEENASGIKRWTDGVTWSPSRILGNFLVYRELSAAFPPGEKKKAQKKTKAKAGSATRTEPRGSHPTVPANPAAFVMPSELDVSEGEGDAHRNLVGSLVDSYSFKSGGLVKKTISISWNGIPHHLVSYYAIDDVLAGKLTSVADDLRFSGVVPRMDLLKCQSFRVPVEHEEYYFNMGGDRSFTFYDPHRIPSVEYNPQFPSERSMSDPTNSVPIYRSTTYPIPPSLPAPAPNPLHHCTHPAYSPHDYPPNDYPPNDYPPNDYPPNDYPPNDYPPYDYAPRTTKGYTYNPQRPSSSGHGSMTTLPGEFPPHFSGTSVKPDQVFAPSPAGPYTGEPSTVAPEDMFRAQLTMNGPGNYLSEPANQFFTTQQIQPPTVTPGHNCEFGLETTPRIMPSSMARNGTSSIMFSSSMAQTHMGDEDANLDSKYELSRVS
ncbi:Gti1/Pac2 family-domain-containing protein [Phialemonium atrogriseum]|uniref:Gti1/Pac2 family-domain-containing protein n=1 Tax=Phialemonium atrogriseum TaxID=1093897 RepID=A0AAJ0C6E9_9PEZI|nr:Gti1/Pac2 family-domain-containing protein [Phialemonium atrogriseum]KAK1768516.1 Gti1/Pac2 family-domain-containing protein [Phialemonium atrogriseum]